jgi:hypothetical protein
MEKERVVSKLDLLERLRGDPLKGLPENLWAEHLAEMDRPQLFEAGLAIVRELLIPDWLDAHGKDVRPQAVLEAAVAWQSAPTAANTLAVKEASKACTAAKQETWGRDHRVPEAARAVAKAILAGTPETLFEALALTEEELLARLLLFNDLERSPEQRRAIVSILRKHLLPAEQEAPRMSITELPPAPYSPESHFELGQRIAHKKFGECVATSVGETWIEIETPAGEKKRLAHKPK